MTQADAEQLSALARQHLPPAVAGQWIGLLRPCVHLTPVFDAESLPAARLGGLPRLPEGVEWPTWEGHGPLAFVGSVDCAALPSAGLDISLPDDGTLAFFYFDAGQLDDGGVLLAPEQPEHQAGARVLHIPAEASATERTPPRGLTPYSPVPLAARARTTAAEPWHPHLHKVFAPEGSAIAQPYEHPVCGDAFNDALWEMDEMPAHRIGGYATPDQSPVEFDAAHVVRASWADEEKLTDEACRWILLAQFDSDECTDMMWGDCGTLFWLMPPDDLAERRFDRALFTWQSN